MGNPILFGFRVWSFRFVAWHMLVVLGLVRTRKVASRTPVSIGVKGELCSASVGSTCIRKKLPCSRLRREMRVFSLHRFYASVQLVQKLDMTCFVYLTSSSSQGNHSYERLTEIGLNRHVMTELLDSVLRTDQLARRV